MELERISVALRPRSSREAVDLGAAMLRANARAVWSAWFAFSLPIALPCIALGWLVGWPWLGMLLIWWLKPLFDRVPLYVLSRAVFDRAPAWRDTLREAWRMPWRGTVASLLWLRVDSQRALRLPLELLEGLGSKQRGPRWRVLRRHIGGSATMLTLGCLQLELVLFLGVFLFIASFVPHELLPDTFRAVFSNVARQSPTGAWLFASLVVYLAISVIEPWYVAAGFGLYVTRRTQLEAWDVDLSFRRLRQRLEQATRTLALLLACALAWSAPSHAAAVADGKPGADKPVPIQLEQVFGEPVSAEDRRFADAATKAYADPRFGQKIQSHEWVLRHPRKEQEPKQDESIRVESDTANWFAGGLNLLLWLLLAVVLVALLLFGLRYARGRWPGTAAAPRKFEVSEAEAPEVAPLPQDLAGAVRARWQAGHRREGLALLYRGCVEQVASALGVGVPDDATEADCLRRARALPDGEQGKRAVAIVRVWQYAAYADRFPSDGELDALLSGWPAQGRGVS